MLSYNQWNYYLSYNKYPIAVYFSYYSDSNSLIHTIRQQLINVGGKCYAGPAAQNLYKCRGLSWAFLTKGNVLTLFFPTWAVFTQFMQSTYGVKLSNKLPLITLSMQGNYLNINYKLGISEILNMGNNYMSQLIKATQYLYMQVTSFIPSLNASVYYILWVIMYIITSLVAVIHTLSNNIILLQEYRSTLLITTNNNPQ